MQTITLLKEQGWSALDKLAIKRKHYPERKLSILNYDQIHSPKLHSVVIECRSLIISDDLQIISRAFDRFFNWGESDDQKIMWDQAVVYEKLDGSLVKLFFDPISKVWELSTRGTLGEGYCGDTKKSYRTLILETLQMTESQLQVIRLNPYITHIFEFIHPENRIVTPYEKTELVLIGMRNNRTGQEFTVDDTSIDILWENGIHSRLPKTFPITDFGSLELEMKKLRELDEGFVVWDGQTRVKVKNPSYLVVHHMKGNKKLSERDIAELVLKNETDEFLIYFPDKKPLIQKMQERLQLFQTELVQVYEKMQQLGKQVDIQVSIAERDKEFARQAKQYRFASCLFWAKKHRVSILEAFTQMKLDFQVEQLLKSGHIEAPLKAWSN
jgi:hypothetical protein